MSKRLDPKLRKEQILAAAMVIAVRKGYMHVQRDDVADLADVSPARVSQLFNTMPQLRRAIMRNAVKTKHLVVIAQGLACRDKQALKAPVEVRKAAAAAMV